MALQGFVRGSSRPRAWLFKASCVALRGFVPGSSRLRAWLFIASFVGEFPLPLEGLGETFSVGLVYVRCMFSVGLV